MNTDSTRGLSSAPRIGPAFVSVRLFDAALVLGFSALALLYAALVWNRVTPYVQLAGDAANIATFAAGPAHADLFAQDPILSDPDRYRFYAIIHVPLVRWLGAAVGGYGNAFLLLLPVHVWLQLTGFYVLGRTLFQSRLWAVMLAAVTSATFTLPLGEIWGLWPDSLPRVTFQALLPFVLALAIRFRARPAAWPWLMLGAGALTYVHPVSAPAWALSIWLGLWVGVPADWPVGRRLGRMTLLGTICVAVMAGFACIYLTSYEHGARSAETIAVWTAEIHSMFRDAPGATGTFARLLWSLGLLPVAIMSLPVVWLGGGTDRQKLLVVSAWLAGQLFVSSVVPTADQAIARQLGRLPLEVDLIRGLRYVVPLLLIVGVWAFAVLGRSPGRVRWAALLALPLAAGWMASGSGGPLDLYRSRGERRRTGRRLADALRAVRLLTPPGATILPSANGLAVRYEGLRPVLFCEKDENVLIYARQQELPAFLAKRDEVNALRKAGSPLSGWVALARRWNADFLLVETPNTGVENWRRDADLVWLNSSYSLFRLYRTPAATEPDGR